MSEKLTFNQWHTLHAFDDDRWHESRFIAHDMKAPIPNLIKRGLMKRRGGVGIPSIRLPIEYRITEAGRLALRQQESRT